MPLRQSRAVAQHLLDLQARRPFSGSGQVRLNHYCLVTCSNEGLALIAPHLMAGAGRTPVGLGRIVSC